MRVEFLTAPVLSPAEALPELAHGAPSSPPELLIVHAPTAKAWLRILARLEAMAIPLRQAARADADPLVALWITWPHENPEPLAVVADLVLLGGGWSLLRSVVEGLKRTGGSPREVRLPRLAGIAGVYVPSLFAVEYREEGTIAQVDPRPGVAPVRGLPGGAPFPRSEESGYRRFFVGEPRGQVEWIPDAVKQERHQERVRLRGEPPPLAVSLLCRVPWPWGPYQWAPMATEERLKEEIGRASRILARIPGVRVTHEPPKWALLEGVLKMGDRRAGELLLLTHRVGWDLARVCSLLNPAFVLHRERPKGEILPWDHIDWGLDRESLWREFERIALGGAAR